MSSCYVGCPPVHHIGPGPVVNHLNLAMTGADLLTWLIVGGVCIVGGLSVWIAERGLKRHGPR